MKKPHIIKRDGKWKVKCTFGVTPIALLVKATAYVEALNKGLRFRNTVSLTAIKYPKYEFDDLSAPNLIILKA